MPTFNLSRWQDGVRSMATTPRLYAQADPPHGRSIGQPDPGKSGASCRARICCFPAPMTNDVQCRPGQPHRAGGDRRRVECEHLASGSTTDWQIWIESGARGRYPEIRDHQQGGAGAPQYTLRIKGLEDRTQCGCGRLRVQASRRVTKVDLDSGVMANSMNSLPGTPTGAKNDLRLKSHHADGRPCSLRGGAVLHDGNVVRNGLFSEAEARVGRAYAR